MQNKNLVRLEVWVSPHDKEWAEKQSKKEGMSLSAFVRVMIAYYRANE
jgi:hypothetical protein